MHVYRIGSVDESFWEQVDILLQHEDHMDRDTILIFIREYIREYRDELEEQFRKEHTLYSGLDMDLTVVELFDSCHLPVWDKNYPTLESWLIDRKGFRKPNMVVAILPDTDLDSLHFAVGGEENGI